MHKAYSSSRLKVVFLTLATITCLQCIQISNAEITADAAAVQERTGTLTLSGSNGNSYIYSALLIVPVLLVIVLLDFAIFGAFARRADELNPISEFFYHVRRGLHISQAKYRRRHGLDRYYDRYRRQGPQRHRISRWG